MSESISGTLKVSQPNKPVPFVDLVSQFQSIAPEVMEAVNRVFASQAFILGDEVAELERDLAEYCGSKDAIGCASGTDALVLSLMAMDIGPGDEVITSPFTFFATAGAIHRVGARPIFADIDPISFNLDPVATEAAITSRTKAVMPVHLFGQCADMNTFIEMADRHGLKLIEDACQAIGAEYHGRRAGAFGLTGCFSFFPTKNLAAAGDGGIITTNDADLATRLRSLRVHGDSGGYRHTEVGLNSRLDALQAAVVRVKLKHLDDWTDDRRHNAEIYDNLFQDFRLMDAVDTPKRMPNRTHVYNQYCIRMINGQRDEMLASLRSQNIGCTVYYPQPLHLQKCFEYLGYKPGDLPESERAANEVIALPIFPELTADQQAQVVRGIVNGLGRTVPIRTTSSNSQSVRRAA